MSVFNNVLLQSIKFRLFFVHFEKTQVRKKLRFPRKISGFRGKTRVFVVFQLTLLLCLQENSGILRKIQVYGYFSDQWVDVKVHKKSLV